MGDPGALRENASGQLPCDVNLHDYGAPIGEQSRHRLSRPRDCLAVRLVRQLSTGIREVHAGIACKIQLNPFRIADNVNFAFNKDDCIKFLCGLLHCIYAFFLVFW